MECKICKPEGFVCDNCYDEYFSACYHCGRVCHNDDLRDDPDGNPTCDDCWDKYFSACHYCEKVYHNADLRYDPNDNPTCDDCWDEYYFTCADCGEVYHSEDYGFDGLCRDCCEDRKGSLCLSARHAEPTTLQDIIKRLVDETQCSGYKAKCSFYRDDYRLDEISNAVGEVDSPIYLYGLIDREEYEMALSPDLHQKIRERIYKINGKEYLQMWGQVVPITILKHHASLGISKNIRTNHFDWVCEFIKELTTREEKICVE